MLRRSLCPWSPVSPRLSALVFAAFLASGASTAHAVVIDFEGFAEGTKITDSVLPPGFTIAVTNGNPAHPNQAIVFDSSCVGGCSGDDIDLQTPGQGTGNDAAQEHVLIIAEDVRDTTPADGLVDDPDDERRGGTIVVTFPTPRAVDSLRVIDIDTNEGGSFVELALANGGTLKKLFAPIGNNSAQTIVFPNSPFANSITLRLRGSGAFDDLVIGDEEPPPECPDNVIDFENGSHGTKLSSTTTSENQVVGVTAINPRLAPGVNAAIIYDSSCPGGCTGDDHDLGTPNEDFGGPGIGEGGSSGSPTQNDQVLGNLLIVATNLTDANSDGLVDNPNDQKNETVTMELDFSAFAPVSVFGLDLVDVGDTEGPASVELFDENGNSVTSATAPNAENNGLVHLSLPPNVGVWSMVVTLRGSGGIDNILVSCPTTTSTTLASTTTTIGGGTTTTLPVTTTSLGGGTTTTLAVTTTSLGGGTTTTVPVTTTSLGGGTTTTVGVTTTSLGGGTTTTLPSACPGQIEICNNTIDDDGDLLIDCADPDCILSVPPPCGCAPVLRDPAYIRFDTKKGADLFSMHGNFRVYSAVDFASERFGVILTNANGTIWRGTLVGGELRKRRGGKGIYAFRDPAARGGGPGDSDNFYRVGMRIRSKGGEDKCHFRLRAYGDFKLATEPRMTVQLIIGDDSAGTTQDWKRTQRGWVLYLRDFDE